MSRERASLVAQAICGVTRQLGAESGGLSGWGGSQDNTSTAAPAARKLTAKELEFLERATQK